MYSGRYPSPPACPPSYLISSFSFQVCKQMADKLVGQSNELWHLQHWAEVAPKKDLLKWMRSHHKGPLPPIEEVKYPLLPITIIYMYY